MTTPETTADRRLDGNALAGPLAELFAVDLSGAVGTCGSCDGTGPMGEQHLYADAPALVLRCRDCTGVLLRVQSDGDHLRADLSGLRLLVVPTPGGPGEPS